MPSKYVFDSSALIAFLCGEADARTVESVLLEEGAEVYMSAISLGEVINAVQQLSGDEATAAVEAKVFETPKLKVMDATWPRVKHAERLRRERLLSFTGSFSAGLAQEKRATLVTKDCEFGRLEEEGELAILWISNP